MLLAGGAVLGAAVGARAQVTVVSSTSDLLGAATAVYRFDPVWDTQASQRSIDLVGDWSRPVFVAAVTDGSLLFRLRLNEPASGGSGAPGTFGQVAAIGIDIDGSRTADLAFAVTGKNGPGVSAGQSFFMPFGDSLSSTPNTTSWGSAYGAANWVTSGADADFNYSLVSAIDGAVGNVIGSAGPNTFLTFAVSFDRLQEAIRALGGSYADFTVTRDNAVTFLFSGHTGTQINAVNVDVLSGGQVIPEASTWAFLAAGVAPLLVWSGVRRIRLAVRG